MSAHKHNTYSKEAATELAELSAYKASGRQPCTIVMDSFSNQTDDLLATFKAFSPHRDAYMESREIHSVEWIDYCDLFNYFREIPDINSQLIELGFGDPKTNLNAAFYIFGYDSNLKIDWRPNE